MDRTMENLVREIKNKYSFLGNLFTNFWKSWIKSNTSFKLRLQNVKWKNSRANVGCAYNPTEIEHLANVITHGLWIIPAVFAAIKLFERSRTSSQLLVSWVYGGALIMVFTVSTFFHYSHFCSGHRSLKNVLHRCDRAMIYVFIASSYFPWLQLENPKHSALLLCMEWIIWVLAIIGIAYQQVFHERYKCLETCNYILMGLGPALVVLITGHKFPGMAQLKLGGFFYMLGICFFKSDGVIPMAHAIWHLFVVIAASFHYYAILVNLYPLDLKELKQ